MNDATTSDATVFAEGHCLCGEIHVRVMAPLRKILVCHCSQCQRWHGQAAYYTRAARRDLQVTGENYLSWFQSSEYARRGFCSLCGSNMFWAPTGDQFWSIAAGLLYPGEDLSVAAHIFCDYGTRYETGDPRVPCFGGSADGVMDQHHN